jgi:type II secretory pathway pseudopilin PulG
MHSLREGDLMGFRQGFLLIELIIALMIFGFVVTAVLRLVADVVKLQTDIVTRTDMLSMLRSRAEGGKEREGGFASPLFTLCQETQPLAQILAQYCEQAPSLKQLVVNKIIIHRERGATGRPLASLVVTHD